MEGTDFWIFCYEIRIQDPPRACRIVSSAPTERKGAYLVEISPPYPLPGETEQSTNRVVLLPRWQGTTLSPLSIGPKAVYVLHPLRVVIPEGPPLTRDDYTILDWATVHTSVDEALAAYPAPGDANNS